MMTQAGIFYIVYGQKALAECRTSVASVRKHMPGIPITILADEKLISEMDIPVENK